MWWHCKFGDQIELEKQVLGYICPSKTPFGPPLLFQKKYESLCMCINYRALNKITIKKQESYFFDS